MNEVQNHHGEINQRVRNSLNNLIITHYLEIRFPQRLTSHPHPAC
ncbi:hypothetical protein MGMO_125c00090 [Methyloglobulus morosus KoM1]|uniref:Uncharacterized protein n=1 Tax=Methyloglobulus morosus KoM1 TaxID=1116472 RepID=V5BA49_9GAMM|nr:hypothetical protein MGMO_125c00090 [Methyloglobulus morosus KoM1]